MRSGSNPKRKYWGGVSPYMGEHLASAARRCEEQGLYGVLAGQGWGPPWTALAAAAAVTRNLQLGAAVAIAGVRSPFETAMAALDLDRISGGRFVLGLGTSTKWITRGMFGAPDYRPQAHLRETVAAVRHIIRGAHRGLEPFHGEWFQAEFSSVPPQPPPVRETIPIWLGALGSVTTRLAGEIADGIIGHPLWGVEWWLGPVQEHLRQGLQRSGRSIADCHRCAYLTVLVNPNRDDAKRDARLHVVGYAALEQYTSFFEAQGFGDVARGIQKLLREGQHEAARRLVPDAMVRALAVAGTPDEVREQVERVWQVADSMALSPPSWGVSRECTALYQKGIAETFYGTK
jgi:alkanesulfonate monooxygenase SsuD/methylene tetrahydromethanopterin reductase-like flavin-dependent oxidoreductase (luciferase family)